MALAASVAGDYDFLLWLNDDVVLDPGALSRLLGTYRSLAGSGDNVLVVGGVRDPLTGAVTYSGVQRRSAWRRTHFTTISPSDRPLPAETMHGNLVLVPYAVVERIGQIDGSFCHGMADFDYGLRARAHGCAIWVAPGTMGTCAPNLGARDWANPALPIRRRLRLIREPKGLPPSSWLRFTRRHAGPLWPVYWVSPNARLVIGWVLARIRMGGP
jgi:GT2 family glycosyltransferase